MQHLILRQDFATPSSGVADPAELAIRLSHIRSIVIEFECSKKAAKELRQLHRRGELTRQLGRAVIYMEVDGEGVSSNELTLAEHRSGQRQVGAVDLDLALPVPPPDDSGISQAESIESHSISGIENVTRWPCLTILIATYL